MKQQTAPTPQQPPRKKRRRRIKAVMLPENVNALDWLQTRPETCWVQLRLDTLEQMLADARLRAVLDYAALPDVE